MKRLFLIFSVFSLILTSNSVKAGKKWWQEWPEFPKGLRITAQQVLQLQRAAEKMVFIYAGYELGEGDKVVCGSLIIPYIKVPPYADGSNVKVRIPKDWWIICFCP
ncbi:MAG: hypothetical protein ACFFB3_20385 [Candidatus Hodarchaeota archaeon]